MVDRKSLDKFYTNERASTTFLSFLQRSLNLDSFENIVEPSAGAGALLKLLPKRAIGVDIAPEFDGIIKSDFFDYTYPEGSTITIGNPPFGNRSSLAIEFFKHAAKSSDAIAFIIPVTWEKFTIQKKLPEGWALIASERLPEDSFELDGKSYKVRCCMQIWVKSDGPSRRLTSQPTGENPYFDFVRADDCEFAIRQAYPKTVLKEDIDGQSHYFIKPKVPGVLEVFQSFNWQDEEGKRMLGGTSVPCLDKDTVVKFYLKYADLRKVGKELADHPHFIASINYDPTADFVIRSVRPVIKDDLTLCLTNFKGYYSIKALVPGVREVFESIDWEPYWNGVTIPSVGKPEMYQAYEDKINKENICL